MSSSVEAVGKGSGFGRLDVWALGETGRGRGKGEAESFPLREERGGRLLWKRLGNRFSFGGSGGCLLWKRLGKVLGLGV